MRGVPRSPGSPAHLEPEQLPGTTVERAVAEGHAAPAVGVFLHGARTRGWWEEYRDNLPSGLLDLAELEYHATAIRVAVTVHMPGLLQTSEHARATMREAVPPLRPYEIEHRVSYRVKRQAILFEGNPTPYTAIVHEAALRMGFGGTDVARAQLRHLRGNPSRARSALSHSSTQWSWTPTMAASSWTQRLSWTATAPYWTAWSPALFPSPNPET